MLTQLLFLELRCLCTPRSCCLPGTLPKFDEKHKGYKLCKTRSTSSCTVCFDSFFLTGTLFASCSAVFAFGTSPELPRSSPFLVFRVLRFGLPPLPLPRPLPPFCVVSSPVPPVQPSPLLALGRVEASLLDRNVVTQRMAVYIQLQYIYMCVFKLKHMIFCFQTEG